MVKTYRRSLHNKNKPANLATTIILQLNVTASDFLRVELEEVALPGECDELLLEIFIRQQHPPLLPHKDGGGDGPALPVHHRVRDSQSTAPVHPHDAVDQHAAARLPSILDDVVRHVEVLHHVVRHVVLGVELHVPAKRIAVESGPSSAVSTVNVNKMINSKTPCHCYNSFTTGTAFCEGHTNKGIETIRIHELGHNPEPDIICLFAWGLTSLSAQIG